jgi:ankyrin repeat protein
MAAKNGNVEIIQALLKAGADPNTANGTGATVLMDAAMSGSVDAVKALVDAGANVNAFDNKNGQTALMFAAWENRADVIRFLIQRGADVRISSRVMELNEPRLDDDGNPIPERPGRGPRQPGGSNFMGGMTALSFAARDGRIEAVQALVENGADVNHQAAEGSTPIVIAIANGHYTVGKYLLDKGADPNIVNIDGLGPLYSTINMRYAPVAWAPNPPTDQQEVDSLELLNALIAKGADPSAKINKKLWFSPTSHDTRWVDSAGSTPFWRAAQSSDVEAMRILIAAGADTKSATNAGVTPLMVAAGIGWIGNLNQNAPDMWLEAVKLCIEVGNDVNAADNQGYTALHGAAALGDHAMIQYLVDKGANVNAINRAKNSPADMAFGPSRFFIPRPETAEFLVKLGSSFQNNCRSDQCVDGKFLGGANATKKQ